MNILPYSPLPGHHRAFSYTKSEQMHPGYLAEQFRRWMQEHTADDLVHKTKAPAQRHAPHKVGDDYDDCERSAHLDFIGGFK